MTLDQIIDLTAYPLEDPDFRRTCRDSFNRGGVLVMPNFTTKAAIASIYEDGITHQHKSYACTQKHTVYLSPPDPAFDDDHPRNRMITSSKGCITDDLIPDKSTLRAIYNAGIFRDFLCDVLGETALYPYADPQSSINIHYAETGQELGWHFDNSSFAITLMIQSPEQGGQFEYVENVRNADAGDMNFDAVGDILDGKISTKTLNAKAGTLVLFRGRNAMHRVTINEGQQTRMLVVLAYNTEPDISLSKEARMTFYGRVA